MFKPEITETEKQTCKIEECSKSIVFRECKKIQKSCSRIRENVVAFIFKDSVVPIASLETIPKLMYYH